jgi:murein DD-endopeptidase MepM/ murein hydrolase activator NlpD
MARELNFGVGIKNGQLFLFTPSDGDVPLAKDAKSFLDTADRKPTTRQEVRLLTRAALSDATLYDKMWTRFKIDHLLDSKYGIKRCYIACNTKDKFSDSLHDKNLAAKGIIIQRVIVPTSQSYGIILQCIIGGGDICDQTNPDDKTTVDENGDQERTSKFQQELQAQLDSYAATFGAEKLEKLLSDASDISDKGFTRYFIGKIAEKLGVKVGTDKALDSAVPIFGWVNFAATTIGRLDNIGPKLQALNYAVAAAGSVQLYMTYRTVADEMKSGHVDIAELGSFASTLSDTLQLTGKGGCDMTDVPMYGKLILGKTKTGSSHCKCNNGQLIPAGKLICDEEKLNGGNKVANAISNIENNIPGWNALVAIANAWNGTVGKVFRAIQSTIGDATGWLLGHLPFMGSFENAVINLIHPLLDAITNFLIPSPFSESMSGGRIFTMMAAGDDVAENKACMVQLGCAKMSTAAITKVRNQKIADDEYMFQHQSMVARVFDTNSQYSLASKAVMSMPTSAMSATDTGIASLISNPFGKIAGAFASIFSGPKAFAADTGEPDEFGVTQNGYPSVPGDPDTFWNQNCVNGPLGVYDAATDTLDVSAWLDAQSTNPSTGETEAADTNGCLLLHSSGQILGGLADPSLLPKSSTAAAAPAPTGDITAYKNPYRGITGLVPERIDGGVDYTGNDGPIYAVGAGKVVMVKSGAGSGWPGDPGAYIMYQLSDGPAAGKFVYFAEDCTPKVKVGDAVTSDTVICNFHYVSAATEIGWGDGNGTYATDDYRTHGGGDYASNTGQNMSALLVKLGAPAGIVRGTKSAVPMPAGWPTW